MVARQLMVVSVNATGTNPDQHSIVEVAAVNTVTEQAWDIAVPLTAAALAASDPDELRANGYYRRGLAARAVRSHAEFPAQLADLAANLAGNTLGGSFPEFAAAFLNRSFTQTGLASQWHYRLADIGSLTAGAFGMLPTTIPKLAMCCRLWGVPPDDLDTALGNVRATVDCFSALARYNATAAAPVSRSGIGGDEFLSSVPDLPAGI